MNRAAAKKSILMDLARETLQESSVKEFTVKLTLPNAGKPYLRADILTSLVDTGLEKKDIVTVGPLNDNSQCLITFTNKDAVIKALSTTPVVHGYSARLFSLVSSIVQCRIHWLPLYIPMVDLVIAMSKYGAVQSCSWDLSKIEGFQHVRSTVRNIVLDLSEAVEVPSLDQVFFDGQEHKFLITVPGRGPVCVCQKVGHTRQNCTEVYCRHCKSYGKHSSETCTVTLIQLRGEQRKLRMFLITLWTITSTQTAAVAVVAMMG